MIREKEVSKVKKKKKGSRFLDLLGHTVWNCEEKEEKKREERRYADRQRGDLMGKLLPNTLRPRDRIVTSNKSGFCDN